MVQVEMPPANSSKAPSRSVPRSCVCVIMLKDLLETNLQL
jgi:hypothetical protein